MKNFGLYKNEILFYTSGGSFAADAWNLNDGMSCGDVSGDSFTAVTADDGHECNIGRRNVYPISKEQFDKLFPTAHPALKLRVELDKLPNKKLSYHMNKITIPYLFEQGFSYEAIKDYFIKNFFKA